MANNIKKCPHCGNVVEGKRIQSYGKKLAKTGAKSYGGEIAGDALKYGSAAAGAAIGSVVPVVGTILGAGVGYLVGIAGKNALNESIDKGIDSITEEEYEFKCPKCGHSF